jgi:hypothetical protein
MKITRQLPMSACTGSKEARANWTWSWTLSHVSMDRNASLLLGGATVSVIVRMSLMNFIATHFLALQT